jgi:hypothetical protein
MVIGSRLVVTVKVVIGRILSSACRLIVLVIVILLVLLSSLSHLIWWASLVIVIDADRIVGVFVLPTLNGVQDLSRGTFSLLLALVRVSFDAISRSGIWNLSRGALLTLGRSFDLIELTI